MQPSKGLIAVLADLVENRQDSDAWESLSAFIWPTVSAAAARFGKGVHVESLHNEVLMRIYRYAKLQLFKTPQEFRAYVYAVVRKVPPEKIFNAQLIADSDDDWIKELPATGGVDLSACRELLGLVSTDLSAQESKLANLLVVEGLSRQDIAEKMGVTLGALAAKITRLKQRITEILESERRKF